ncbi:MAG: hypothetical protein H0W44_02855 [Gammaproteobacteria bacterium]|nr:hypothetical protein [Gammaproteobacteria bacterium]
MPAVLDLAAQQKKLQRLYDDINEASWFTAVGEPMVETEQHDAEQYIKTIGFASYSVKAVANWSEARRITMDPEWDQFWWKAEEKQRKELFEKASKTIGEYALLMLLTEVNEMSAEHVHGHAALAAARMGVADQNLSRVAAGSASQACFQAALAMLNDAGEGHPFMARLRLFTAGRWPLSVSNATFYVF